MSSEASFIHIRNLVGDEKIEIPLRLFIELLAISVSQSIKANADYLKKQHRGGKKR